MPRAAWTAFGDGPRRSGTCPRAMSPGGDNTPGTLVHLVRRSPQRFPCRPCFHARAAIGIPFRSGPKNPMARSTSVGRDLGTRLPGISPHPLAALLPSGSNSTRMVVPVSPPCHWSRRTAWVERNAEVGASPALFVRRRASEDIGPERPGVVPGALLRRGRQKLQLMDRGCPLPVRRSKAVRPGVPAADDHHVPPARRDEALVGNGVSQTALVLQRQVFHGKVGSRRGRGRAH